LNFFKPCLEHFRDKEPSLPPWFLKCPIEQRRAEWSGGCNIRIEAMQCPLIAVWRHSTPLAADSSNLLRQWPASTRKSAAFSIVSSFSKGKGLIVTEVLDLWYISCAVEAVSFLRGPGREL
jgi:hypothetical protein